MVFTPDLVRAGFQNLFFFKMFSLVTFGSHNILDPLVILFVIALLLTFSAPCPKRENARNSRHVVS
jgi:hypothetical protein